MNAFKLTPVAALVMALSACGGGGGDGPSVTNLPTAGGSSPSTSNTASGSSDGTSLADTTATGSSGSSSGASNDTSTSGPTNTTPTSPTDSTSGSSPTPTPTSTERIASIVALQEPSEGMFLNDLNENGHAAGWHTVTRYIQPLSVSATNVHVANRDNFYDNGDNNWRIQVAGNNNSGVMAGMATTGPAADSVPFAWTWNGAAITRLPLSPDEDIITGVFGIADDGRVGVNWVRPATGFSYLSWWNGTFYDSFTRVNRDGDHLVGIKMSNNGTTAAYGPEADGVSLFAIIYPDKTSAGVPGINRLTCGCQVVDVTNTGRLLIFSEANENRPAGAAIVTATSNETLPTALASAAMDMNDRGDVVGGTDNRPQLYLDGQLLDLNSYTQASMVGWTLQTANLINNNRQIVGRGLYQGRQRWYLMTLK